MTEQTLAKSSKKVNIEILTQERLKEVLVYNPINGIFKRRVKKYEHFFKIAPKDKITIDGNSYKCGDLAFLYTLGYFSKHPVEYLNGHKDDNRWSNINHGVHSLNYQKPQKPQQSEIPPEYRETAKLVLNLFQGAL